MKNIEIAVINWQEHESHRAQIRVIVLDENWHTVENIAETKDLNMAKNWIKKQKFDEITFKVAENIVTSRQLKKAIDAEIKRLRDEEAAYWAEDN